jgi:hypothetical protein
VKYRRRDDGKYVMKNGHKFTNQHVVPYNEWLLEKYDCHLCVLNCTTKVASIRYLFKYVTKGVDMATIRFQLDNNSNNEISTYLSGRYISAPAAIW